MVQQDVATQLRVEHFGIVEFVVHRQIVQLCRLAILDALLFLLLVQPEEIQHLQCDRELEDAEESKGGLQSWSVARGVLGLELRGVVVSAQLTGAQKREQPKNVPTEER